MNFREYREFAWQSALTYLGSKTEMDKVRKHMALPEVSKPQSLAHVYKRLLQSLSNRQGMPNTIGKIDELDEVFFRFDHRWTLQQYSRGWEGLFNAIRENVRPTSRMDINNRRSHWVIFCKGSISGAEYLDRFTSLDDFLQFVADFDEKPSTRQALPLLLAHEIFGFGFALAGDFLKELGFSNFSKPDVHLTDIFTGLELCGRSPLDVFRTVSLVATEVEETPYAVDKAFWLIGSGSLYLHNQRFETSKDEFIALVKRRWADRASLQELPAS
jgi:hypothetical protein